MSFGYVCCDRGRKHGRLTGPFRAAPDARLRVDNLHYDLTEDELEVRYTFYRPEPALRLTHSLSLGSFFGHCPRHLTFATLRPRRPFHWHCIRYLRFHLRGQSSNLRVRRRQRSRPTHPLDTPPHSSRQRLRTRSEWCG